MNIAEIRRLVKLVEESQISELEIQEENLRVRVVKRHDPPRPAQPETVVYPASPPVYQPPAAIPAALVTEAASPPPPPVKTNFAEVKSPMVGTFYRAPSPEAPSYVQVGDRVKPGQVLCIIEAMKLMNEIEAEVSGRVADILVENAQPVEFGRLLFIIEQD